MNRMQRLARNTIFRLSRLAGFDRQLVLAGKTVAAHHAAKTVIDDLSEVEFRVFSQFGEDGIIEWLVSTIPIETRTFIEIGVEDYREANTRFLLMNRNWRGLVVDGNADNIAAVYADDIGYKNNIQGVASFVTAENICQTIAAANLGTHVGLLSLDVDGVDWWILKSIKTTADVIVVEFNDFLGPNPVTVPYDPSFMRFEKHWSGGYWGASLSAFTSLLSERGYFFVGTNAAGVNAFFVAKKYEALVREKVRNLRAYSSAIRDARSKTGTLTYKAYKHFLPDLKNLPLLRVDSMQPTTVGESGRLPHRQEVEAVDGA